MVHRLAFRQTLITALSACAEGSVRLRARRFLMGLSADELEFIAGFLGACIVESSDDLARAAGTVQFHQSRMARASLRRSDHENKMIVLREYLHQSGRELRLSRS
jgi:hypothetical protein